jgi:hypothetical protein
MPVISLTILVSDQRFDARECFRSSLHRSARSRSLKRARVQNGPSSVSSARSDRLVIGYVFSPIYSFRERGHIEPLSRSGLIV